MLDKLLGEIQRYNKLTGKDCSDFVIYRVPSGESLGWVDKGAKMTWELDEIDLKHAEIKNPQKMPDTLHKGLVYKPFFYIKKPKCLHGNLLWPEGKDGKKSKNLAQIPSNLG
jgi:hypothetical protein